MQVPEHVRSHCIRHNRRKGRWVARKPHYFRSMKSFTAEFKQYGVDWSRVPVAQQQKLYDFFETHMYQHPYLVARATHATIVRGMKPSDFPVQPCCCPILAHP
jgi:hypothetical protein